MGMSYGGNNSRSSFYEGGIRKGSNFESGNGWGGGSISSAGFEMGEKEMDFKNFDGTSDFSPPMSTAGSANHSTQTHLASPFASNPSRNSLSTIRTGRSLYGPNQTYSGPILRSQNSNNRLSGAPHQQMQRIEIVPPLPLGGKLGAVVATDKHTIGFSEISGIGGGGGDWFIDEKGVKRGSLDEQGPTRPINSTNSSYSSHQQHRLSRREMEGQINYETARSQTSSTQNSNQNSPTTNSSASTSSRSLAPPTPTTPKKRVPPPKMEALEREIGLERLERGVEVRE